MIGSWTVSNNTALKVLDIEHGIEDKAIVQYENDKPRKVKIYYGNRDYIRVYGQRFYFDECIRA